MKCPGGDAACAEVDPEVFEVHPYQSVHSARTRWAKRFCEVCPIVEMCLNEAIITKENNMIMGNKHPSELRAIRGLKR